MDATDAEILAAEVEAGHEDMLRFCECGDEFVEHQDGGCNLCDCRKTHRDFLARLTEENSKLLERIEGKNVDATFLKADVERLTEENTRYREALDEIEKVCTSSLGEIETIATCLHVARAALVKGEA